MLDLQTTPLVSINHQRVTTTSLLISRAFDRQHKDVLRAIERLECSEEFGQRNFAPSSYLNEQNKPQPMFNITRDGFTFLAMGFTGAKAAQFKEAFIDQFNRMERMLACGSALAIQNTPQNPVTTKVTVNTSELVREAHKGNRFAQRLLHHLTGMQIDDLSEEVQEQQSETRFNQAELIATYLDTIINGCTYESLEAHGLDIVDDDEGRTAIVATTTNLFGFFNVVAGKFGLPVLAKSVNDFGQMMGREAAALEFFGYTRSLDKVSRGRRFFRYQQVGGEA
jgi:Rha family phage regulatory protein